ncbi:hypothetical protein DRO53_01965 [Candidatus Bathyarchaeota archaeon]|nr:MAG: hypothetical protein DRO46_04450 [Candidatus Hecatellales archaeon]RLI35135.1 MAG: hypothetical protein DRO53_01965 [Candidatus Bathyarchaeota archaeon]
MSLLASNFYLRVNKPYHRWFQQFYIYQRLEFGSGLEKGCERIRHEASQVYCEMSELSQQNSGREGLTINGM